MKRRHKIMRVGTAFDDMFGDFKRQVPLKKSNPEFSDELTATIKSGKLDQQIKTLLKRRYNRL